MSKENMTKMVDFANQISCTEDTNQEVTQPDYSNIDTNFSRVYGLLETKFRFGSFTSSDVSGGLRARIRHPNNAFNHLHIPL